MADKFLIDSLSDLQKPLERTDYSIVERAGTTYKTPVIGMYTNMYVDTQPADTLSLYHIGRDEFWDKVRNYETLSNEIYFVSGEYEHMYGRQIKFVGEPTESSDAATKNYVDDTVLTIEGAVHFKGVVASIDDITSAKYGDVIIVNGTAKEYIYTGTNDEQYLSSNWSELGNENLYATILEIQQLSTEVFDSVNSKIFIDGLSSQSLSVMHIDQEDFYQKVLESSIMSNEIYIVSGDYINAYGQQIKNLAEPSLNNDAVTKEYADKKSSKLFVEAEVQDESCIVSSQTVTTLSVIDNALSFYFGILPVDSNSAREMTFVVDCTSLRDEAPSVIWPQNFYSKTDISSLDCLSGVCNVFKIEEYAPDKFIVDAWKEPSIQ